jgi:hypothetical protein
LVYQISHHHLGWGTGISGVYYPADGWTSRAADEDGGFFSRSSAAATPRDATPLNLAKPFRFDGVAISGDGATPTVFESIDTTAGTLVLFPSWLSHSADLHTGDATRVSVAFNVRLGRGPPAEQPQRGAPTTLAPPPPAEAALPIYIPNAHCTPELCGVDSV